MSLMKDVPIPRSSSAIRFATRLSSARQIGYAFLRLERLGMAPQLVPGALKRALDLLEADPARGWTVDEIASACGIGRRTLQRHFRCLSGRTPMQFLRDLRLDRARQELLRASASITLGVSRLSTGRVMARARRPHYPATKGLLSVGHNG
jgi:transcriptional regulator GlxA family with amidase domain